MSKAEKPSQRGYALFRQADVGALTTFRVPARAALLAELYEPEALQELLAAGEVDDPRLKASASTGRLKPTPNSETPSPLKGEGWGEGDQPTAPLRGASPRPDLLPRLTPALSTSWRGRRWEKGQETAFGPLEPSPEGEGFYPSPSDAVTRAGSLFVLGGGSNVLFTRDYPGAVLRIATRGIQILDETGKGARLRVAAGENWDRLVRWTLAQGLAGLENLILIPGTVGAAPIQNIGAYGVELAEFLSVVEAWDGVRGGFVTLDAKDCRFAYRDSRFKHEPGRHIVTAVELELPRARALRLDYAGLPEELQAMGVAEPTHADVARAVERLRRRKLPDPAEIGNAGSFFKNPVVSGEQADALKSAHPALPVYPAGEGMAKLSAAWLIEAAGFKGRREGAVGVSAQHALVLVNYGGATGAEVLALAERIRVAVAERFGLTLEAEPKVL